MLILSITFFSKTYLTFFVPVNDSEYVIILKDTSTRCFDNSLIFDNSFRDFPDNS